MISLTYMTMVGVNEAKLMQQNQSFGISENDFSGIF